MADIKITQLDNGLRIVSERLTQFDSVSIGVWIRCGMVLEPDRLLGSSHYLEHMLFKGTRRRNAREISAAIDNVGGHLNGYTEREHTCLFVHLLGEHLELALDVLLDMTFASRLAAKDLETEREVLIQEARRLEDNPEDYIHDLAVQAAWPKHPLGRSLHGSEASIRAVNRRNLLAYYRANYAPERIVVSAAGALKHEKLVESIAAFTQGLGPGKTAPARSAPGFSSQEQILPRETEQVHFCVVFPASSQTDDDRYAQALYDTILGGATSSRLFQEIREKRGLVYSIGSYAISCREGGLLIIHAGTDINSLAEVRGLILKEAASICRKGVTAEELQWAKSYVRGSLSLARESTSFRMQRLARAMLYHGEVIGHKEVLRRYERVTAKKIQQVAERFLSAEPTIVALGPTG